MDKNTDAKPRAGRFYRQIAEKSVVERAKKIRRLSCFNAAVSPSKEDSEMGLSHTDTGNDSSSLSHSQPVVSRNIKSKRFPMSKRFFDGFTCVDHAAVPRRLRSAMKKRICESASPPLPDSKKQNQTLAVGGGGEYPETDGMKEALMNLASQSSPARQVDSDGFQSVTKDEEEVAETLFALAGLFHDTKTVAAAELHGESPGANAPTVPEMGTIPASEIKGSSDAEVLKYEAPEMLSLTSTAFQEQPEFGENTMCHAATDSLDKGMLLSATAECKEENLHSLHKVSVEIELRENSGINQLQQQAIRQDRMHKTCLGVHTDEPSTKESGNNGLTLWPSLSSALRTSGAGHRPSKLADAKLLAWLGAPNSVSRPSSLDEPSSRKFSKAAITKTPMKRCATHVYLSHRIQALKMPEDNGGLSSEAIDLNLCKVLKENVLASLKANRSNRENNEIDGIDTTSRFGNFTAEGNLCEAETASNFVQQKSLLKHLNQFLPAFGSQKTKQEFDFLSLLVGRNNTETEKDRTVSGPSSHLYAPYLRSILPFSAQQTTPYISFAHVSKNSVPGRTRQQVQLQLPLHHNSFSYNTFREKHSGISGEPQQQQFCAAQGAARSRTTGPSVTLNQFPNWLQVKHEHSETMFPTSQAILPLHPMYMDAISTKYNTVGQHQQPLKAASSLYTERIDKVEERQLASSVYEEGRRGFRLPRQWLCNESL